MARNVFAHDDALLQPAFGAYKIIGNDGGDGSREEVSANDGLPRAHLSHGAVEESHVLPDEPMSTAFASGPAAGGTTAGYKQLKDWANIAMLVPGHAPGQAAYISAAGFIILVVLGETARPSFSPIHRLSQDFAAAPEAPGLVPLGLREWLISDGAADQLVLLHTVHQPATSRWSGEVRATWSLPRNDETAPLSPFRIRAAQRKQGSNDIDVLLQRARRREQAPRPRPGIGSSATAERPSGLVAPSRTSFELVFATVSPRNKEGHSFHTHARYSCEEPPYLASFDTTAAVLLFGESAVRLEEACPQAAASTVDDTRTHMEEPQPQPPATEARNDETPLGSAPVPVPNKPRTPPFAWYQTEDSVVIAFKVPFRLGKDDIRCRFSGQHIDLELKPTAPLARPRIEEIDDDRQEQESATASVEEVNAADMARGRYLARPLWSGIDPAASLWTWEQLQEDKDNGDGLGLLSLHLEKKHSGTRWASAFLQRNAPALAPAPAHTSMQSVASAADHDGAEDGDDEDDAELEDVPETLDPSALLGMLEGMEKYTADEAAGVGARGLGGASGMSTRLLQDGLEEEDATVGRPCVVSMLRRGGEAHLLTPTPETLLARPLPATSEPLCQNGPVLRHDLDGLFYSRTGADDAVVRFEHADTLPALSYVLASKRDAQHVYVHRPPVPQRPLLVLAFEAVRSSGGSSGEDGRTAASSSSGAGNLFVYYSPQQQQQQRGTRRLATEGQSRVVRLGAASEHGSSSSSSSSSGSSSGHFVAAAAVRLPTPSVREVLLILCQRRLLVLHNVL